MPHAMTSAAAADHGSKASTTPTTPEEAGGGESESVIGPGKKLKLFPSALITNVERDELHQEIYNYFKWLERNIITTESTRKAGKAGVNITGVQGILKSMESLKSIRDDSEVFCKVVEEMTKNGNAPFLERHCGEELAKRLDEVKESKIVIIDRRFTRTWEERCSDLICHKQIMNMCTYEELNFLSSGLGDWLKRQRALYAKNDANFMKKRAPMLSAITEFQWKAPPHVRKQTSLNKKVVAKKPQIVPGVIIPASMVSDLEAPQPAAGIAPFPFAPLNPVPTNAVTAMLSQNATAVGTVMLSGVTGFQWKAPPHVRKQASPKKKVAKKSQIVKQLPPQPAAGTAPFPFAPLNPVPTNAVTSMLPQNSTVVDTVNPHTMRPLLTAEAPAPIAQKKPAEYKPRKPAPSYDFDEQFNQLLEYKAEHGDMKAPSQTRLGRWIYVIRKKYIDLGGGSDMDPENSSGENGDGISGTADNTAATTGEDSKYIPVLAPPGNLGLGVLFQNDKEGAEKDRSLKPCCIVTAVHANCSFKTTVRAGDHIVSIDGHNVYVPEDLSISKDRHRTVSILIGKRAAPKDSSSWPLTQEQIQRLNTIGFSWEAPQGKLRTWEQAFQDLLSYYRTHGDFRVVREYKTAESHKLGNWVHRQRFRYSKKDPKFMRDCVPKLEAIGFEWVPRRNDFQVKFKELLEYKKAYGNVDVPYNNSISNPYRNLGRWVASLRLTKERLSNKEQDGSVVVEGKKRGGQRNDHLNIERIQLLESIGFDWARKIRGRKKQPEE